MATDTPTAAYETFADVDPSMAVAGHLISKLRGTGNFKQLVNDNAAAVQAMVARVAKLKARSARFAGVSISPYVVHMANLIDENAAPVHLEPLPASHDAPVRG
jgi:hypothetical protein